MNWSRMNPHTRRFTFGRSLGSTAPSVRVVGDECRADPEIVFFIWSFSFLLLVFLLLVGGWVHFVWGLLVIPFAATIQIALSKMGGKAWAWTMASLYSGYCFLWLWVMT